MQNYVFEWPDVANTAQAFASNYQQLLDNWHQLANESLANQSKLAHSMVARLEQSPLAQSLPVEKMEQLSSEWASAQSAAVDQWFSLLAHSPATLGFAAAPTNKPVPALKSVAKPAKPVETAPVAKPADTKAQTVKVTQPVEQLELAPVAKSPPKAKAEKLEADDLKLISGVGPALEGKLNAQGIERFEQISAWSAKDIDAIEDAIMKGPLSGRIRRDDWVKQAKTLMRG